MHLKHTRIAPTPSGYLHLGNAYSFVLTAALAKQYGANILLRIDDLDRDRINPAYVQDVFDTLNFLEINWQRGPHNAQEYEANYSQVHRLNLYQHFLQQLASSGGVFACTCSRAQVLQQSVNGVYPGTCLHKQLPLDTPGAAWRLDTSHPLMLQVKTINGEVTSATLPKLMQYFVVRKKDGYPAYQVASVADDVHFGIDMVVRGADLWDSTLAQLYLAKLLGLTAFADIAFHHHQLVLSPEGQKLSKSEGATSIKYLRMQGAAVQDVYEMIGLPKP